MQRDATLIGLVAALAACAARAPFPPGPPPLGASPSPVLAFPQAPAAPLDVQADDAGAAPTRAEQEAWARRADETVRSELHPRARACLAPTLNDEPDPRWRAHVAIAVAPNGTVTDARIMECVELMPSECDCIAAAARSLRFASPGSAGARLDARYDLRTIR